MCVQKSFFSFLKKPALCILFFSSFLIPKAFSFDVYRPASYNPKTYRAKLIRWDFNEFPLKLCIKEEFTDPEHDLITLAMLRWNKTWQKFRSQYLYELSPQCKPPNELFLLGCEKNTDQIVIDVYKDTVNKLPVSPDKYDPHHCLAGLRTSVRTYIMDEYVCRKAPDRILLQPTGDSISFFYEPFCQGFTLDVVTHELGHVLGIAHIENLYSLMGIFWPYNEDNTLGCSGGCLPGYPEFSAFMAAYTLVYGDVAGVKERFCVGKTN